MITIFTSQFLFTGLIARVLKPKERVIMQAERSCFVVRWLMLCVWGPFARNPAFQVYDQIHVWLSYNETRWPNGPKALI